MAEALAKVKNMVNSIGVEKQDIFLKLVILSSAMILGKLDFIYLFHLITSIKKLYLFLAFSTRLFSVIRYESVIHEFDPYFNYRTTKYLVEEGFYKFHNWFDDRAWYPLGRIIGGTIYPGNFMFL